MKLKHLIKESVRNGIITNEQALIILNHSLVNQQQETESKVESPVHASKQTIVEADHADCAMMSETATANVIKRSGIFFLLPVIFCCAMFFAFMFLKIFLWAFWGFGRGVYFDNNTITHIYIIGFAIVGIFLTSTIYEIKFKKTHHFRSDIFLFVGLAMLAIFTAWATELVGSLNSYEYERMLTSDMTVMFIVSILTKMLPYVCGILFLFFFQKYKNVFYSIAFFVIFFVSTMIVFHNGITNLPSISQIPTPLMVFFIFGYYLFHFGPVISSIKPLKPAGKSLHLFGVFLSVVFIYILTFYIFSSDYHNIFMLSEWEIIDFMNSPVFYVLIVLFIVSCFLMVQNIFKKSLFKETIRFENSLILIVFALTVLYFMIPASPKSLLIIYYVVFGLTIIIAFIYSLKKKLQYHKVFTAVWFIVFVSAILANYFLGDLNSLNI